MYGDERTVTGETMSQPTNRHPLGRATTQPLALAFGVLTLGLIVAKAFGAPFNDNLLYFTAALAGLDAAAILARGAKKVAGGAEASASPAPLQAEASAEASTTAPDMPQPAPRTSGERLVVRSDADARDAVRAEQLAVVLHARYSRGGHAWHRIGAPERARWEALATFVVELLGSQEPGQLEAYHRELGAVVDAVLGEDACPCPMPPGPQEPSQ